MNLEERLVSQAEDVVKAVQSGEMTSRGMANLLYVMYLVGIAEVDINEEQKKHAWEVVKSTFSDVFGTSH